MSAAEEQRPALAVVIAAASDIGDVREHNEDHLLVADLDAAQKIDIGDQPYKAEGARGPFLVVCDGMGGVEGGEIASELASAVLWREMKGTPATRDPEAIAS